MTSLVSPTFLIFSFSYSEKWADFLCRWLTVIAVVFPIITIVFFVLPDVCTSVMRPIWLDICGNIFAPGGRNAPYKVGFTNHYSTNGIYCSIACICCYLKVLFNNKRIWIWIFTKHCKIIKCFFETKRKYSKFNATTNKQSCQFTRKQF